MQTLAEFSLPKIDYLATWVASWLEPLSRLGFGAAKWETQARDAGAFLGILFVLALLVGRVLMGRRRRTVVFFVAFGLMLVLLSVNVGLSIYVGQLTEETQILLWRDKYWYWAYVLFCASIPCFVATSTYLLGTGDFPTAPTDAQT
jgi:hypothetical protein